MILRVISNLLSVNTVFLGKTIFFWLINYWAQIWLVKHYVKNLHHCWLYIVMLSTSAADWQTLREGHSFDLHLAAQGIWLANRVHWWRWGEVTRRCGGKRSFGPAHHSASETEEGMEKVGKTEWKELPALLLMCLFSEKCSPSCTSTMPAQNDRGYCTPNHCVVGRERERNRGWEREKM